jgi:hypothetical protein
MLLPGEEEEIKQQSTEKSSFFGRFGSLKRNSINRQDEAEKKSRRRKEDKKLLNLKLTIMLI